MNSHSKFRFTDSLIDLIHSTINNDEECKEFCLQISNSLKNYAEELDCDD